MSFLIYTFHVLICLFLIAVVLLQQGKGADLSVFGGGGTQTAFGARGAATVLHKLTVGSFIGFLLTTILIGVVQTQEEGSDVFNTLPDVEEAAAPQAPAGALPTGAADENAEAQADGSEAAVEGDAAATDDGSVEEAPSADGEPVVEPAGTDEEANAEEAPQTDG